MDIFLSKENAIKIAIYYCIVNYVHYMEEQKIKIKVSSVKLLKINHILIPKKN